MLIYCHDSWIMLCGFAIQKHVVIVTTSFVQSLILYQYMHYAQAEVSIRQLG